MTWTGTLTSDRHSKLMALLDSPRAAEHLNYASGDREFAAFLLTADALAYRHIGVSIFDLPDACWRDFYNDEMIAAQAVKIVREAGI